MTIDYLVKEKAIDLHLQGRGRNEIARILNGQKMRISEATITHLIQDWKKRQSQQQQKRPQQSQQYKEEHGHGQNDLPLQPEPDSLQEQEAPTSPSSNNSKYTDDSIIRVTGPPSFNTNRTSGDGQAVNINSNFGPLSHFLSEDTDTDTTTTVNPNSSPIAKVATPVLAAVVTDKKSEEDDVNTSTKESDHMSFIKVEDPEAQIDIEDIDHITTTNRHIHTQTPEVEKAQERIECKSQPPISDSEDNEPSIEIDWDSDQNWQRRFFRSIMDERRRRKEQILLIDQKTRELNEEKQNLAQIRYSIDQQNHNLEVRENKLIELEPFIPLAKQLQAMKIDITNFLPWVETVHEYAVTRNTDLTTTAYNIADDLREYRQLGSLHKAIEHTRQQLSVLDAFTAQKL
jgi:hypothetical protein